MGLMASSWMFQLLEFGVSSSLAPMFLGTQPPYATKAEQCNHFYYCVINSPLQVQKHTLMKSTLKCKYKSADTKCPIKSKCLFMTDRVCGGSRVPKDVYIIIMACVPHDFQYSHVRAIVIRSGGQDKETVLSVKWNLILHIHKCRCIWTSVSHIPRRYILLDYTIVIKIVTSATASHELYGE